LDVRVAGLTTERLSVRTVAIPVPGDVLGLIPGPDAVHAWVRRGVGLVGWGEAAQVTLPAGNDRFTAAEKWLREVFDGAEVADEVAVPGTGLIAFGSFTFDDCSDGSVMSIPRVVVGADGAGRAWLTTITPLGWRAGTPRSPGAPSCPLDPGAPDGSPGGTPPHPPDRGCPPGWPGGVAALPEEWQHAPDGDFPGPLAWEAGAAPPLNARILGWRDGALSAGQWEQAVAEAVRRIARGDLRKAVLARDLRATADCPIDARVLLARLAERYPDCYTFACAGLVGATPELLIRRDGHEVRSLVLAGTMPRGETAEDDARLAAALLASAKEAEEHFYAADSVRQVLAPLCDELAISPAPELLTFPNVHHLGTRVTGRLATDRSALSLAAALHPTAAVGGDPPDVAVDLIRELENMDRGRYAGPIGWMDAHGNGEWGIALRCAQLTGNQARLFAGCGIVAGSDPAAELAETMSKFRPMRSALEDNALEDNALEDGPLGDNALEDSAQNESARDGRNAHHGGATG
jgi:menaquinone-specific isochorismate synthase